MNIFKDKKAWRLNLSIKAKKRFEDKTKHPMYGKKQSLNARKKISQKAKKRIGVNAGNWKGGRMLVGNYWYIYSPNHPYATKEKYVCEHRLVMEKYLKRILNPSEVVHHINGQTTDNRIKNLIVCQSTGKHTVKNHISRNQKTGRFS